MNRNLNHQPLKGGDLVDAARWLRFGEILLAGALVLGAVSPPPVRRVVMLGALLALAVYLVIPA